MNLFIGNIVLNLSPVDHVLRINQNYSHHTIFEGVRNEGSQ